MRMRKVKRMIHDGQEPGSGRCRVRGKWLHRAKTVPGSLFRAVHGWRVAAKAQATATRCATFLRFLPKRNPAAFSINRVMM